MGNRKAEHNELLAAHEISRDFAAPWLLIPVLNMPHSAQAAPAQRRKKKKKKKITKWQRTSSQESDEHRHEFGVIYVWNLFKVTKLEE